MAVSGNLVPLARACVGKSYQSETVTDVDVYGWVVVDLVSDTSEAVTLKIAAAIWYNGYNNYIPWEIGVYKVDANATTIDGFHSGASAQGYWEQTSPMWSGSEWAWYWLPEQTFTINKSTTTKYGLMPYLKIGAINRWGTMGKNGDFWIFGNYYGVIRMTSVSDTSTHVGLVHRGITIDSWVVLAGKNDASVGNSNAGTATWTYANCPYTLETTGTPSNRRKVLSVTYYDSSGSGHTIPLI